MQGHCLCGVVRFSFATAREIGACHCGFCRRWGGGPLLAVHCGPEVDFTGADHIKIYDSSSWARRAFCRECGTHLYYRLLESGEYFIPAGVIESNDLAMTTQIYVDRKPPYYAFANETPMLTEQDVIDRYGAPGGDAT